MSRRISQTPSNLYRHCCSYSESKHLYLANSSTSAARATAIGVAKDVPDFRILLPFHFDSIEIPNVEKLSFFGSGDGLIPPSLPRPSLAWIHMTPLRLLAGYARGLLPPLFAAAANIVMLQVNALEIALSMSTLRLSDSTPNDIEMMCTFMVS